MSIPDEPRDEYDFRNGSRGSHHRKLRKEGAVEDARDLEDVRAALADPENRDRIRWEDLKAQRQR